MEEELQEKINRLKKDMLVSFTKYSISGKDEQNDEALLNSVLLSWFDDIGNAEKLQSKYEAFQKMDRLIKQSYLFDFASSAEDSRHAQKAIDIYFQLLDNEAYKVLTSSCGYRIPREFGRESCYLDGTLKQKVKFYHEFCDKLNSIYRDLSQKGVFHR